MVLDPTPYDTAHHLVARDCGGHCVFANTESTVPFPHLIVRCQSCGVRGARCPMDYVEPVPLPPAPDTLDALLVELRRACLAQFPDGKGESLYLEAEKRLRAWEAAEVADAKAKLSLLSRLMRRR